MSWEKAGKITGRAHRGMISIGNNGSSRADRINTGVIIPICSVKGAFPISSPIFSGGWEPVEKKHRSVDRITALKSHLRSKRHITEAPASSTCRVKNYDCASSPALLTAKPYALKAKEARVITQESAVIFT